MGKKKRYFFSRLFSFPFFFFSVVFTPSRADTHIFPSLTRAHVLRFYCDSLGNYEKGRPMRPHRARLLAYPNCPRPCARPCGPLPMNTESRTCSSTVLRTAEVARRRGRVLGVGGRRVRTRILLCLHFSGLRFENVVTCRYTVSYARRAKRKKN